MCGIVGLFLKDPALRPRLGALLAGMLKEMSDRGPDSAGFAVYGEPTPGRVKLTLRRRDGSGAPDLTGAPVTGIAVDTLGGQARASVPEGVAEPLKAWLAAERPEIEVVAEGGRIELYKDVGAPAEVAARFGLSAMSGTHAIGHTRMATESAVTTDGAHPFSTGPDQCLVHNGSLSNHAGVRRELAREGITFATQNDSEVAAGYLSWRMAQGDGLERALESSLDVLDGFYTFVVGTRTGFAVLRDPISCKPAVMAETDRYVAFGSEYRALAGLPGIEAARVFEPKPARVYAWEHA